MTRTLDEIVHALGNVLQPLLDLAVDAEAAYAGHGAGGAIARDDLAEIVGAAAAAVPRVHALLKELRDLRSATATAADHESACAFLAAHGFVSLTREAAALAKWRADARAEERSACVAIAMKYDGDDTSDITDAIHEMCERGEADSKCVRCQVNPRMPEPNMLGLCAGCDDEVAGP